MPGNSTNTKSTHIKTGIASAVALLVFGLGVYALVQGILQKRLVFVIESVVPIMLGGWRFGCWWATGSQFARAGPNNIQPD